MSKLMTLYIAFEFIRAGQLSIDEKLPVSVHAESYGGSTMFLDTTDRVAVADLLRGIIVLSGNDACAVIAEALSPDGTEAGFAKLMTRRAQQLGMTNSTFQNSNGGHGVRLGARLGFFEVLGLNKVEVVQHADPDDAGQHMEIAKEKFNVRHACVSRFL